MQRVAGTLPSLMSTARNLAVVLLGLALFAGCAQEQQKCTGPGDCTSGQTCAAGVCVKGSPSHHEEHAAVEALTAAPVPAVTATDQAPAAAQPRSGSKSEVIDLLRPVEGEYLGLYLGGKKIGYTY